MAKSDFGQWFSGLLRVRGITQGEFARNTGIDRSIVSKWINTSRVPSEENCDKIATELGIPFEEVLAVAGHRVPVETHSRGEVKDRLIELMDRIPSEVLRDFIPMFERLAGETP